MFDLEEREDIVEVFIDCATNADKHKKTVGLIANRDLIEFTMGEIICLNNFNVKKVNFEQNDFEYMISINPNGDIVVQPITEYYDKYFKEINIAYISMDGDVRQEIIDNCLYQDKEVVLFGLPDYDLECDGDCENCELYETADEDDGLQGFTYSYDTPNGNYRTSFYSTDIDLVKEMAKQFK